MKTEPTQGPWAISEHSWAETSIQGGGRTIALLSIESDCTEENQEEWERKQAADAALIAAAPELVTALEGCVELVGDFIESFRAQLSPAALAGLKAKLQPARAALEKAGRGVEGGGE